jgi:molecular chaperone HscB
VSEQQAISSEQSCWHCGNPTTSHFCAACQRIQPLIGQPDYFTFFQLPRSYQIDLNQLERQYYELSRQFHPDFFFNASQSEQQFSMERSSLLNDAYRTLRDPLKRANYLLEIEGLKSNQRKAKTPPDLLSEIFELNEQLEELRAAKRAQASAEVAMLKPQVRATEEMLKQRSASLQSQIHDNFQQWDGLSNGNAERRMLLEKVNEALSQLSYINNLIDDIDEEFSD